MSASKVHKMRAHYNATLRAVMRSILETGAYFAMAGPEILGESDYYPLPTRYLNKIKMLDDYRAINKAMAREFNVSYIDVRQAFVDAIPPYWHFYSGYVTVDGEHENERGTQIVAELFAANLLPWLQSVTKKELTPL